MNTAQQLLPGVNWFDVPDPASPDLDELARRFHLHELQIEDCRHRPQRAKVDEYGTYMFAVLKHLVRAEQGRRLTISTSFSVRTFSSPCTRATARFWRNSVPACRKTTSPGWTASSMKSPI